MSKQKIGVPGFGIFKDEENIQWLIQSGLPQNAVGLPADECPLRSLNAQSICPHSIDLNGPVVSPELLARFRLGLRQSKFLQQVVPLPNNGKHVFYLPNLTRKEDMLFERAMSLVSPCINNTWPMQSFNSDMFRNVSKILNASEFSRFILHDVSFHEYEKFNSAVIAFKNCKGRLFMAGEDLPMYQLDLFCETLELDKIAQDILEEFDENQLRSIGATLLKSHMRSS